MLDHKISSEASLVAQMVKHLPAVRETWVRSPGWDGPLEEGMAPHSDVFNHYSGGSDGKASACSAGDLGSIPGLGRSSGEGNSNPLQYFCLENPMNRGAWWAAVHRVKKELGMT